MGGRDGFDDFLISCADGGECEDVCCDLLFTGRCACCKCKGQGCFPSGSRVSLENGESVAMAELKVGDKVQTGEIRMFI